MTITFISVLLSLIGIYLKKPYFLLISAVLLIPTSIYLAASPGYLIWGLILPLFYIGGYLSLKKNNVWLSLLISAPAYLIIGWLGYIAFTS